MQYVRGSDPDDPPCHPDEAWLDTGEVEVAERCAGPPTPWPMTIWPARCWPISSP